MAYQSISLYCLHKDTSLEQKLVFGLNKNIYKERQLVTFIIHIITHTSAHMMMLQKD